MRVHKHTRRNTKRPVFTYSLTEQEHLALVKILFLAKAAGIKMTATSARIMSSVFKEPIKNDPATL